MNPQKIIQELLEIDPSLADQKDELEKLISKLIKSKPDFEINQAFIVELKEALHTKATKRKQNLFLSIFNMKTFQSFGAGALLTALLLTPLLYSIWGVNQPTLYINETVEIKEISNSHSKQQETEETVEADFFADESIQNSGIGGLAQNSISVNPMGSNAFGNLSSKQETPSINSQMQTTGQEGDGEISMSKIPSPETALSADAPVSSRMIMPHNPTEYKYIYNEELPSIAEEITVYRKDTSNSNLNAQGILTALNLELLDSSVFQNITAQNISLKENRKFGYSINLYNNDEESRISIYKNWEQWPNPNENCDTPECYEKNKLKASDVPSDEKIIEVANAFADTLKIDLNPYADPVVKEQKSYYLRDNETAQYISEEISVVYPLLINNQEVKDENGQPTGLNISVNIRHMKASGLNGLTFQKYDSAKYQSVKINDLKAAIEKGTHRGQYPHSADSKVIEVKLGTPEKILTKIWYWNSEKKESSELLVPALHFPVIEQPDEAEYFYRDSIVIPLAADLFEEEMERPMLLRGQAEPMIEPAPIPMQ